MYQIELEKIPNQSFTTNINDNLYDIELRYNGEITLFTLKVNNKEICKNIIVFPNQYILPYKWQEQEAKGNFIFINGNDEYPFFSNFDNNLFYFIEK